MSVRLTKRRIEAILEALGAKLAGEIDDEELPLTKEDYETAHDWAIEELERRSTDRPRRD